MNSIGLISKLVNLGYQHFDEDLGDIRLYVRDTYSGPVAIGIIDYKNDGMNAATLRSNTAYLEFKYGIAAIIYVIFTRDADNAKAVYAGDDRHWIYDVVQERLIIYEDQPAEFGMLRRILEEPVLKPSASGTVVRSGGYTVKSFLCVNTLLVLVNVVIFIIMEIKGSTLDWNYLIKWGAEYSERIFKNHEYYRFLTAMFLHSGFEHIMGNMVLLAVIGMHLEQKVGSLRYFIIYMISGIMGNIVSLIHYTISSEAFCTVGASGAVFGVLGGVLLMSFLDRRKYGNREFIRILIYIALSVYSGYTSKGINLEAHIGGLVCGLLVTGLLTMKGSRANEN